jgi:hypothetical protein
MNLGESIVYRAILSCSTVDILHDSCYSLEVSMMYVMLVDDDSFIRNVPYVVKPRA